jgi:ferric-chelate reductase (NADPH)
MSSLIKRTLLGWVGPNILYGARIAEVTRVSENFRFIDIETEIFKTKNLQIGEKVQINAGDWNLRTYTPLSLNPEYGLLGVLVHLHGNGPGSQWASQVRVGDMCQVFGPHASLKLPAIKNSLIFFGDETTLALATHLKRYLGYPRRTQFFFEANSPNEVRGIVRDLGLPEAQVFAKSKDGFVSSGLSLAFLDAAAAQNAQVLLAGKAQSIQQMRFQLKTIGFPMSEVTSKVYWSEGKSGLD